MNIKSGVVYLTLGTIQEVQWLTKDLNLELEYLYEPTTLLILNSLETTAIFEVRQRLVIIIPKKIKGTPRKITAKTALTGYELPSDELVRVDPNSYFFVVTPAEDKDAAKKIQGGIYELLNLGNNPYGLGAPSDLLAYHKGFPYVIERKLNRNIKAEEELTNVERVETQLIKSLTTMEGVIRWGSFSKAELFAYFITPEVDNILILMASKAWCLEPYLRMSLTYVEEQIESDNPSAHLQKFAYWVYCSTKFWADSSNQGLNRYRSKHKKYEGDYIFTFKPSARARLEYNKTLGLIK